MKKVILGLGSNRNYNGLTSLQILSKACASLSEILSFITLSSVYISKPMYYEKQEDDNKTSLEAKVDNGKVLTTKPYYRDSLKYADMIMQLNGSENVDLSEYDQKKEQNNKDNKKSTRSRKSKQNSIFA